MQRLSLLLKKFIVVLLVLVTPACGKLEIDHKVEGSVAPLKIEPVKIEHVVQIDMLKLEEFYRTECASRFSVKADVDACVSESIDSFIKNFSYQSSTAGA